MSFGDYTMFSIRHLAARASGTRISKLPGLKPVYYLFMNQRWALKRLLGPNPQPIEFLGQDLYVDTDMRGTQRLFMMGERYIPAFEWALMREFLSEGAIAFDVGSFIGTHLLAMNELVGPSGGVYGFEPQPECVTLLERTIEVNGLDNCIVVPFGVGDKPGSAQLYTAEGPMGTSTFRTADPWNQHSQVLDSEILRLDDFVSDQEIETIDFLKLDVQGAELAAVEGMKDCLSDIRGMQIEIHTQYIKEPEVEITALYDILASAGDMVRIDNSERQPVTCAADLLFDKHHPHILWTRA